MEVFGGNACQPVKSYYLHTSLHAVRRSSTLIIRQRQKGITGNMSIMCRNRSLIRNIALLLVAVAQIVICSIDRLVVGMRGIPV